MDIYKYIVSKDVREYNERIGHKFTAIESAFLVWKNYDLTLQEKHEAWREIMREMSDEEVKHGCDVRVQSLFALLEEFIKVDNALIEEFYKKDEQTVYSYGYCCKGSTSFHEDWGRIYSDFGYMQGTIKNDFDDILYVEYTKKYLSSPFRNIVLVTDKNGNVMSVAGSFVLDIDSTFKKDDFFEELWIDVPTPFRVGDIVCSKKTPFGYHVYGNSEPFVLLSLANWGGKTATERGETLNEKEKAWRDRSVRVLKENGDCSDMTAVGYFLCSDYTDGRFTCDFYSEVMQDYVDLEYYHGEFIDGERALLTLSHYLKGDINEETLVKTCEIIKKQEESKRDLGSLNLLDEWIEKLKIKNDA